MNEKVKGLVIGTVVLAALGGTLGILKLTGADKVPADNSSSSKAATTSSHVDESVQLINVASTDIAEIDVSNTNGTFTYMGPSESGKTSASITELKGLEAAARKVSDIGEDTAQLTAYKLVESGASDLGKYGLAEPEAEFLVKFADGTERTFLIGINAHQNRYRYLCEKGSDDVYMVMESTISAFLGRKEDLLNTTLLVKPEASNEEDTFGKLTVHRKDLDYDIVFENDDGKSERSNSNMPSAQVMTEPIFSYLNGTTSTDVIYSLYGLTAMEATVIFPTDEQKAEYGLDDPSTVVTFTGEGYDYKLCIGNEYHDVNEEGSEQSAAAAYYCTFEGVEGKDCIWKIDATALPWVDLDPINVITTLMTWNMVVDVNEVKITGDGGADFKLTSSGEGDSRELTAVTCDGKDVSVDLFKSLYQYLLTCPTNQEIYFKNVSGDPYLTIEINCGNYTDKIELFKDTERRSVVKLNGRVSYRIQSKWADRLIKNIEAVKTGGTVEEDY